MLESPIDLIQSTVQLEQTIGTGERVVGTGFLVSATNPDGSPRTILITANHVLAMMPGAEIRIGYRSAKADGGWSYTPGVLRIRDERGAQLWTRHAERDVAAISITAPPQFARAAIPLNYLATDDAFVERNVQPGDELLVLGYPRGLSANTAGFPILRSGRVASYPVSPRASPTFLLDFSVFPGNSGGPVFSSPSLQQAQAGAGRPFVAGILTQQVELNHERLEIGIVTHAKYIVETINLMSGAQRPAPAPRHLEAATAVAAQPVAYHTAPTSLWGRLSAAVGRLLPPLRQALAGVVRSAAERALAWAGPATAPPAASEGMQREWSHPIYEDRSTISRTAI